MTSLASCTTCTRGYPEPIISVRSGSTGLVGWCQRVGNLRTPHGWGPPPGWYQPAAWDHDDYREWCNNHYSSDHDWRGWENSYHWGEHNQWRGWDNDSDHRGWNDHDRDR
ncbi:MAG: hypothetical protein LC721_11905, partial [Actinobacteria bacterium]|nr:hypothetical protein [Actinomycetota bacterium]